MNERKVRCRLGGKMVTADLVRRSAKTVVVRVTRTRRVYLDPPATNPLEALMNRMGNLWKDVNERAEVVRHIEKDEVEFL